MTKKGIIQRVLERTEQVNEIMETLTAIKGARVAEHTRQIVTVAQMRRLYAMENPSPMLMAVFEALATSVLEMDSDGMTDEQIENACKSAEQVLDRATGNL